MIEDNPPFEQAPPVAEPVWTYRGYQLRASEFTTAMVHFFRAEVNRANVWRMRLDTTTNWAVVTTGAALSFTFAQTGSPHIVILLDMLLVTLFLLIEARRYRYYELWSYRVRLMETDFYAAMLVPPFHPSPDWAEALAENLLTPHFPVSIWEALGRRLRRNYLWIYLILGLSWVAKITLFPRSARSWEEILARITIGPFSGQLILLIVCLSFVLIFLVALATAGLHQAAGEVLPRFGHLPAPPGLAEQQKGVRQKLRAWFRPSARRQQLLTFIITDRPKQVSERIMEEMGRGVTVITGEGAYTGRQHAVLMCALTVTEVAHLKALVSATDPQAFAIVSPAQGVFGKGFMPLEED
ncbi:MAG: DUF2270 domain-containing protein [Chloroflexi bacterium]|nr:DUF2270 domain-containing protein [Chloroflexota bacterium]